MTLQELIRRKAERVARWALWNARCRVDPGAIGTFTLDRSERLRVRYPLRSAIGRALSLRSFEIHELDFMRATLRPGHVCFDVGANGGIMTVTAARSVGSTGHVHAFEAGVAEQELLRDNVRLNGLRNVTFFDGAVSNVTGSTRFAVAEDGAFSSLSPTQHPRQVVAGFREVPATTLDDYVEAHHVERVDFLKVDVEGAEKLVFEGASRLLAKQRPLTILFEAFDASAAGFGYSVAELFALLRSTGFDIRSFDAEGRLVPLSDDDPRVGKLIYNFVARA